MTRAQNDILHYAYRAYLNGQSTCTIPFTSIEADRSSIRNALDELSSNGLLVVRSVAIGSAIIILTDSGLSFCQGSYGK